MDRDHTPLLGIDWGTSNRRAYLLDARGKLLRQHDDHEGILAVAGNFETSLAELLRTLGLEAADVVMSGMVGSRNGWREAPYLAVSHALERLPDALMEIPTALPGVRCRVAPGYQYLDLQGNPDVMRGEETQIFGARRLGAPDAWYLLPGTHSKWVRVEAGKVIELVTFMTGELYALLSQHGTLSKIITDHKMVPEAFEAGLNATRQGAFTHMAFCCRARVVTDMMPATHTASYLSGLLIGAELHDILQRTSAQWGTPVQIIGSPALMERYLCALELWNTPAQIWQPDQVFVAGLASLFGLETLKGKVR